MTSGSREGRASTSPGGSDEIPLGERAVRGSAWTALRFGASYALRLATNLILTRLLVPEAFGLMALVSALMTGLALFSDIGIRGTIVQNPRGHERAFLDTVWTIQVMRGGVLYLVAAALSALLAGVYGVAELRPLILVAGLTAVVSGFDSVSLVLLQRRLHLGKLAAIEILSQLLAAVITIVWAWLQPTVWALVWGALSGSVCKMLLSHLVAREHSVRLALERDALRELLHFGKWIFLSSVLFFLAGQADRLIFGKLLSVAALGVFSVAVTFSTLATQVLWRIGHSVLFPALSRRNDTDAGLAGVYARARLPLLLLGVLPVACLGAGAPELIEILYDPRYADAGWMLQILAVGAWFQIPQTTSGPVVLARGVPRWLAIANGVKFCAMVVALPLGYSLAGTAGAIAGLVAAELGRYVTLALGVRAAGLPVFAADLGATALVVAAAVAGLAAREWAAGQGSGSLLRLTAALAAVLAIWGSATSVILRHEIAGLLRRLQRARAAARREGPIS